MSVPYTFASATGSIPLSQLDANFATGITIGNSSVLLGGTITTLNNMSLANVAITSVNTQFPNGFLANSNVIVGTTTINLGSTVTTVDGLTLSNVTISSGNVTISNVSTTNVSATTANVTTANVGTLIVTGNETAFNNITAASANVSGTANISTLTVVSNSTVGGNVTITGNVSASNGTFTSANVSGTANVSTFVVIGNETIGGNSSVTGNITAAKGTFTSSNISGTANVQTLAVTQDVTTAGNVTLGSATTNTVTVKGYMALGTPNASRAINIESAALTGTAQVGVYSTITGTSAATASVRGFTSLPSTAAASFTVTDVAGYWFAGISQGAGSTITNAHGLYISDPSVGTNNYGITSLVSSGSNKWNIYASGTANNYFAGNVGIGTSSPSAKLDISGAVSVTGTFSGTQAAGQMVIDTTGITINRVGANYVGVGTSATTLNYTAPTHIFSNQANSTEWMRINSSGNLGIGTTSPVGRLMVYGSSNIIQTNTGSSAALTSFPLLAKSAVLTLVGDSANNENYPGSLGLLTTGVGTSVRGGNLYLYSTRSTNAQLNAATYTPLTTGDSQGAVIFGGDNGVNLRTVGAAITATAGSLWSSTNAETNLAFSTCPLNSVNAVERMRIDGNGYVGIGTTSPAAVLHLAGNFTASSWTTNGINFRIAAATYTDSSTAASGTVASSGINAIARPTIAASNATVTYTDAATLYVANSPANGTNVTITNALSLWVDNGTTRLDGNITYGGLQATQAAAPTVASSATIAPTTPIAFVSGTTTINTITAPAPISAGGGQITLIPTGLWSTGTSGNIALATTAVVSKALIMTYDTTTAKWYPSY